MNGGLKMVNIHNFIASLKCTWIKKLPQCHKPWMDIFKEIIAMIFKKDINFVDVKLLDKVQRNNIFCQNVFVFLM